ncbi:hypothetical protein Hanom_Chr09g00856461 [Helianthus anomalus]
MLICRYRREARRRHGWKTLPTARGTPEKSEHYHRLSLIRRSRLADPPSASPSLFSFSVNN